MSSRLLFVLLSGATIAFAAETPAPQLRAAAAAYSQADRAFQAGDFIRARDLTRELAQRFPDDPQNWLRVAVIEEKLGAFDLALDAYDQALDVEAAYSIDGGRQLEKIHLQRARLLVAEAQRDLAASGEAPLGDTFDSTRAELRRALALAGRQPVDGTRSKTNAEKRPAHGYVVETSRAPAPADTREAER